MSNLTETANAAAVGIIAKETRDEAVRRFMRSNGDYYWDHPD